MRQYDSYKPTGVKWIGDVPEHWNVLPLFSTMKERFEKNTAEEVDDVLSLSYGKIVLRDVSTNFGLLPESFKTYQIAYPNDIIIRPTDLQNDQRSLRVGKVRQKGIITSAYICLQPLNIDADYAHYLLFAYDLIKIYYQIGAGVRQTLKFEDLKRLPILIPSLTEQSAIAKFLDEKTEQIDKLIDNKRRLIELLREERTVMINQAVTKGINEHAKLNPSGIDWFGDIPEHWLKTAIKYIASKNTNAIVDGPFGSSINVDTDYVATGVPVIRTVNITERGFSENDLRFMREEKFAQLKRHAVYPDDVLFSKVGTIGNCCIFPNHIPYGILSTTGSCKISVDSNKILNSYIVYLLNAMREFFHLLASSNVQPFLNMSTIKNVRIAIPPIAEQAKIVEFIEIKLSKIDLTISKVEKEIELLQEYRTASISEAVTGKIKVI